jgi:hypothetical protein
MSHPIRPERLIRQARVLAGFGAGRGRPSPINHRRAVSAAYYSLYHAITEAATDRLLPPTVASDSDRFGARRWISHADISAACRWVQACSQQPATTTPAGATGAKHGVWEMFSQPSPAPPNSRTPNVPSALEIVTRAFLNLQAVRHEADYDHLASFPKAVAQRHVNAAARAVDLLRANVNDAHMQRFLTLVVFRATRLSGSSI